MKPLPYDLARLEALTTDALLQQRVEALIGRAFSRQLWLLFLDEQEVQLPLLIPIDGLPWLPVDPERSDNDSRLATMLRQAVDTADAASLVVVIERASSAELTESDLAWARAVHGAALAADVRLRAILLSHRRGVCWVAQDDYCA